MKYNSEYNKNETLTDIENKLQTNGYQWGEGEWRGIKALRGTSSHIQSKLQGYNTTQGI